MRALPSETPLDAMPLAESTGRMPPDVGYGPLMMAATLDPT